MKQIDLSKCLSQEDAFAVVLLATVESTYNILLARASKTSPTKSILEKRMYYLNRLAKDVEGLNLTYPGYLNDNFQENATKYHQSVEDAMNVLLSDFREEK
jgi:hypothetical protein